MKDRTVCRYLFCSQATRCLLCHSWLSVHIGRQREPRYFPSHFLPSNPPSLLFLYLPTSSHRETIENRARKRLANFFPTSEVNLRTLAAVGLASTFPISLLNPRDPHPVGRMEKFSRHQPEGRMLQSGRRQTPQLIMLALGLNILKK